MKAAQLFDVSGLATIVTGAASGIGFAYAEVMADNGARVTLLDKDSQALDAAIRKLAERGGDVHEAGVVGDEKGGAAEEGDGVGEAGLAGEVRGAGGLGVDGAVEGALAF